MFSSHLRTRYGYRHRYRPWRARSSGVTYPEIAFQAEKPGLTLNADGRCLQEARARFFLRRVVNVKPRTSQVNPYPALVSWRGALPPGNAVCGERKHELFFVEFRRLLGLLRERRVALEPGLDLRSISDSVT